MSDPSLPPRVAFTSSVAPGRVSSGRNRIRNCSLPGWRIAYSVYASWVNSRETGADGRSDPSGFVPPGNWPPRPWRAATHAEAATMVARTRGEMKRRVRCVIEVNPSAVRCSLLASKQPSDITEGDGLAQRRQWIARWHELVREVALKSRVDDGRAHRAPVHFLRVVELVAAGHAAGVE